ncbi:MAG: DUF3789 domain-containing protein [Hungatella sp.]|nr:DUF3789 domain-containing protein [Hungatella sp.]
MSSIISFIMGFLLGGLSGVVLLCLCQASKDENKCESEDDYY